MLDFLDVEQFPAVRVAGDEFERQATTLEIEEGFCWDHGYYLGPRCPRCRPQNGEARMSGGDPVGEILAGPSTREETHNG